MMNLVLSCETKVSYFYECFRLPAYFLGLFVLFLLFLHYKLDKLKKY